MIPELGMLTSVMLVAVTVIDRVHRELGSEWVPPSVVNWATKSRFPAVVPTSRVLLASEKLPPVPVGGRA